MHDLDLKTAEKAASAAEGIRYFILKISELLRRSADEKESLKVNRLIYERIKRIELLGAVQGNPQIENLAVNTSIALQNIFKYSKNLRREFFLEVKYFLAAVHALMPDAGDGAEPELPDESDFCDQPSDGAAEASAMRIDPEGQVHADVNFDDIEILAATGSDENRQNTSAEMARSPEVRLAETDADLPGDSAADGREMAGGPKDSSQSKLASQIQEIPQNASPASTDEPPDGQEKLKNSPQTEIEYGTHLIENRVEPELDSILNEVNSFFTEPGQSDSELHRCHPGSETEKLPDLTDREMTEEEANWYEALFSGEPVPEQTQPGELNRSDVDASVDEILQSELLFSELDEIDAGYGDEESATPEKEQGAVRTTRPADDALSCLDGRIVAAPAEEELVRKEAGPVGIDAASEEKAAKAADWQEELDDLEFQLLTVVQQGVPARSESAEAISGRSPGPDTTDRDGRPNRNAAVVATALADGSDEKNAHEARHEPGEAVVREEASEQVRERNLSGTDADEAPSFAFDEDLRPDNAAIGLDISTAALKIVVLKHENDAVELVHWRIYDLDPDESDDERQKNIKHIWASFLTSYRQLRKLPVIASLINNSVLIRYLTLPNMSDANFMKSATLEIQSELFFPEDQVKIFSYPYRVAEGKKSKHKTGILLAIEHRILDEIMNLIKTANIRVARLCIDSLALTQYCADDSAAARAIIDLGAEKVKLVIVQNNEIRLARNIDSYEKSITTEIAEFMGIDLNEAEAVKRNLCFVASGSAGKKYQLELSTGEDINIQNVVYPLYSKLADEIQLTLQYFNSNNEEKVGSVQLTGGGALLQGIDAYLAYILNLPVTIADIKSSVRVSEQAWASNLLRRVSPRLAVAVGLALSHFRPIDFLTDIDLRKNVKIKKPAIKFGSARWLLPIAACLLLLTASPLTFFKIQTMKYQKKLEMKKAMVGEMTRAVESLKSYEGMKERLDTQIQNIQLLKKQQPRWSNVLKILSRHSPNSLWLNLFNGRYEMIDVEIEKSELAPGEDAPVDSDESPKQKLPVLNLTLKGLTLDQYQIQDFISRVEKDDSYQPIQFSKIITREIPASKVTQFDADGRVNISGHGR
ncbi:MAG: pilus assembly protein PilM [Candidatus Zhuqueibacterota bacterium]